MLYRSLIGSCIEEAHERILNDSTVHVHFVLCTFGEKKEMLTGPTDAHMVGQIPGMSAMSGGWVEAVAECNFGLRVHPPGASTALPLRWQWRYDLSSTGQHRESAEAPAPQRFAEPAGIMGKWHDGDRTKTAPSRKKPPTR